MAESLTLPMHCRLSHADCQQGEGGRETESDRTSESFWLKTTSLNFRIM